MARTDSAANSAREDKVRPAAVVKKPTGNIRGDRDEERVSSNIATRPEPATESHAALSSSLQESFGNNLIQSALAGSLDGPAPLISEALTMGAAGLGPDTANSGMLSNSSVAAYLAARDALPAPEVFARDADSRVKAAAARGGKPLPEFARSRLEAAFGGVDFSGVRLHNDGAANQASKAINAKAYTVGQSVYLGHGYDNLQDRGNLRLLIHELTHVVQHMEGRLRANSGANQTEGGMAVSSPTDAVELEAENMATSLLPELDGSILAPMDAELSMGQGMELGVQSAEGGTQSSETGQSAAMRSRDDDNSALDKQSQGGEQNQDQVDGRQNDQESLEELGEWKSIIKAQNERMEALGERISLWDTLGEAERKTLWREALATVLGLTKVALQAIAAALESSEAGLKLGAKLQAVGSLLSLVGWALGDSGPSTGEVKDERTKENKDNSDPSEPRFTAIVGWVQETIGGDADVDFGAQALGRVLEGARKLQDAMTLFLEGIEELTAGVNDLKQVKDQKEGPALKDSKKLDAGQLQKTLSTLSERSDALSAKLSGDAGAEKTPDSETETGPTEDQAATNVADNEQEDAALHGLETAAVKAHGAALQNAPKKLQKHWTGQLAAGTNLGVEKPMRRWTKVKVLDGDQKGAWGYIDRHFFKGRNKEPGRASTKEKRMTRPTRETLHRNASGAMGREATSERPSGGGQSLPNSLKEAFRPILGRSIDSVRIHTDSAAADFAVGVAANAVTVGRDIYFAPGTFSESGNAAKTLIAEELHHAVLGGGKPGVSQPGDDHERKARAFADGAVSGGLLEVVDATFGETLTPAKAQGRQHHPRRALQTLKNTVPTKMLRQLGDALGTSQGSGLKPGAPGVGLRQMGVGGTPKHMRAPNKMTPSATPTPDKRVANRNAAAQDGTPQQTQISAHTPSATAPDLSGASKQALRSMVFADNGTQRYRRAGGTWAPVEPDTVNLVTFIAARNELMSQSGLGGVTDGGRNQALFNTYSQNTLGAGSQADNAQTGAVNLGGASSGTSATPTSGRDHIQNFKTAQDGRRYAVATGADGRKVVIWGARGSSDEDLRERTDRQLAGVYGAPKRNNAWDRTAKQTRLYGQSSNNIWADTSVAGNAWSNTDGMGGSTSSGSYDVLGFEAGGKSSLTVDTTGVELATAVEARAQLFEWKQKWEWQTEQYTLLGEEFSGTFFVSIDAFVGAEAKASITASIKRSKGSRTIDGDEILSEMDTQTKAGADGSTETVASGPEAEKSSGVGATLDASAGAFAGAKVRLGAGLAANWHKKDQGAYSSKMENTIAAGIDTASSAVPGLGWVMRQVGADEVVERLITSVLTWGPEGEIPVLGVEGTGEGSLGVGAQISAKVGFSGGKLSFTWGANATWGVGLGAKVSVNIDALEGIKLALVVGGELASIATDWIADAVSDMAGFGASLWESFWGLFSGDDKVREAVANDAHKLADATQRGEMLKKLMSGWTGGDDQDAMIEILRFSNASGDLNAVLAVADKDDVRGELDGDRKDEFKRMVGE